MSSRFDRTPADAAYTALAERRALIKPITQRQSNDGVDEAELNAWSCLRPARSAAANAKYVS